jgi:cytosine/adenosine deaminase-related metal-dependent hydrolase
MGADWTIMDYAHAMWGLLGPLYTPEDLNLSLRLGLAEALDAGVTQVYDWNHNINSPEHADAAVEAHRASGGRIIFGYGQSSPVWAEALDPAIGTSTGTPSEDIRRIRDQYYSSSEQLLTLGLAARGPEVSPIEVCVAEARQARELGLRQSIHVGNGTWGKINPVKMMRDAGVLTNDITWIHGNSLADSEIQLIADSGGTASCAPELESHMAHGHPAVARFLDAGVRPSLSVDTCTNCSGELFSVMRAALSVVRGEANRRHLELGRENVAELALAASDVLEFATGSLTAGKAADIIVIDSRAPNLIPVTYATGSIVMGAHPGNVEMVLVTGRVVKRDGRLVGQDLRTLRREAETCRDELFARAGLGVVRGPWKPAVHAREI